jgi:hypothetical protein
MLTIEEFDKVCKDAGLTEIQREFGEIIKYALNGDDGHTVMTVEYCDCMEDDDTSVTVCVDKFHAIFSGYSYISKSVPSSTAEWLSKEIETARSAIAEADGVKGRNRITLGELRSIMASLSYSQLGNHSDFALNLGDMTVWEFYEKLTKAGE